MALPVVLVDSTTGSDTAGSGAGPATALTGSAGISAGDGLSVLLDGSPDLSGVATDGSHVLFFNDTTAGNRNFVKITGTSGSGTALATVTVANALGLALTKAWAIGGKRASIAGTLSIKLFSNNSAAGDAMPGWAVEMQSAHAETIAATYTLRRAGDFTTGSIELRGKYGAAVRPILTFSNNGAAITHNLNMVNLRDFELKNSNATKTASVGIALSSSAALCEISGVVINDASNKFWKGITHAGGGTTIRDFDIGNTASKGIESTSATFALWIKNGRVFSTGGNGIDITSSSNSPGFGIEDCLIYGVTGIGISLALTGSTISFSTMGFKINRCTVDTCTSDGVRITSSTSQGAGFALSEIVSCQITGNGTGGTGYGVNFSAGSPPTAVQLVGAMRIDYCNFGTGGSANATGDVSVSGVKTNCVAVAPAYSTYAVGPASRALGYPATIGKSSTISYMDIGCAQRQEGSASSASYG